MKKRWLALPALLLLPTVPGCEEEGVERLADREGPAAEVEVVEPPRGEVPPVGRVPDYDAVRFPQGVTREMAEEGRRLFTGPAQCFACHGADASGTRLCPNLADARWIHIGGEYEEIVALIQSGVPRPIEHPTYMPPMGGMELTDDQVRALAAYVYAISHAAE